MIKIYMNVFMMMCVVSPLLAAKEAPYMKSSPGRFEEFSVCVQRNPFVFAQEISSELVLDDAHEKASEPETLVDAVVDASKASVVTEDFSGVPAHIFVTGIAWIGSQQKVFFEDRENQKSYYLAIGEEEDDIKLVDIQGSQVIFEIGGCSLTVEGDF